MTDRDALYKGVSCAAWGYILVYFSINLGRIDILPGFAGYLLFLKAICTLSPVRRDLLLLRTPCLILIAVHLAEWILWGFFGIHLLGHLLFVQLTLAALQLYFHFQFITDLAALTRLYEPEGDTLDRTMLRLRTVFTLLITLAEILPYLLKPWPTLLGWISTGLMVTSVIVAILMMISLFDLRRYIMCDEDTEDA